MLNSRYVHLHEALGLGPMWLNAQAKILLLPEQPSAVSGSLKPPSADVAAPPMPSASAPVGNSDRLAVLKRVGSLNTAAAAASATPVAAPPVEAVPPVPPPVDAAHMPAAVMVLSMCASPADVAAGRLFSGEDGVLLHKMLAAIGLQPEHIRPDTWLQQLPDFNPRPSAETVAAAAPRVAEQWRRSQARALLLLGKHFFAREDVQQHLAAFAPSGRVFHIPHPQQILSDPTLKRSTWETLQQLQAALAAAD